MRARPPTSLRFFAAAAALLASCALAAGPTAALTLTFAASAPAFPDPNTAVGTLELDLTLTELVARDTGGFEVPLDVEVTGEAAFTRSTGESGEALYTLDPRIRTSTEELFLRVGFIPQNPAELALTVFDSGGWQACIAVPATCDRRILWVSVPGGGFGPGNSTGVIFDTDDPGQVVALAVPEPAAASLLAAGIGALAARARRGRARVR